MQRTYRVFLLLSSSSSASTASRFYSTSLSSYDSYLRLLQGQVVKEGVQLIDSGDDKKAAGELVAQVKFVTFNQLMHASDAPRDPMMRFRDLDNLRLIVEESGSTFHLTDLECSTLVLDLLDEVKRGRRLTKEIVEVFEKMEKYPAFYRVEHKAFNLMIYNTLARDYPNIEAPVEIFGRMLEKEGKASPWTYVCLARVQMFIPPVERRHYRDSFLAKVDENEGHMTPFQAQTARFFIKRLKWITDGTRMALYAVGLAASLLALMTAIAYRKAGREYREVLEHEMFDILDERYYGETTSGPAGRPTDVLPGRAGLVVQDVET